MKKFIKNNKITVVAFIICVIFVILVFAIKLTFFPNEARAIYGDRLDGIKEVEIKDSLQDKIITSLEGLDTVKEASCDVKGRILNVLITVNDDVALDTAKSLTTTVTDNLKKKQTSYYDIQIFISKDNKEDTSFPIIGYKHQDKESFSWTKDR